MAKNGNGKQGKGQKGPEPKQAKQQPKIQQPSSVPGETLPPGLEGLDDDDNPVNVTPEGATDRNASGIDPNPQDDGGIPETPQPPQQPALDPDAPDDPATVPEGSVGRTEAFRHRSTPPKGHIIKAGDPLTFPGEEVSGGVMTTCDVYREIILRGSKTPTYTLLYRKGTLVAKTALNKIV